MIAILDYGVGNLKSIENMCKKVDVKAHITSSIDDVKSADKYILPGVGAFDYGMKSLRSAPFFTTLEEAVLSKKKPLLGICLGMQLLTASSEEGSERGLDWIPAKTTKFDSTVLNLPVPHMGWNDLHVKTSHRLFDQLESSRFYFVHSYHVVCEDERDVLAYTDYGDTFTCSIYHENIFGVQFHPEKSHKFGMQLFKNFGAL